MRPLLWLVCSCCVHDVPTLDAWDGSPRPDPGVARRWLADGPLAERVPWRARVRPDARAAFDPEGPRWPASDLPLETDVVFGGVAAFTEVVFLEETDTGWAWLAAGDGYDVVFAVPIDDLQLMIVEPVHAQVEPDDGSNIVLYADTPIEVVAVDGALSQVEILEAPFPLVVWVPSDAIDVVYEVPQSDPHLSAIQLHRYPDIVDALGPDIATRPPATETTGGTKLLWPADFPRDGPPWIRASVVHLFDASFHASLDDAPFLQTLTFVDGGIMSVDGAFAVEEVVARTDDAEEFRWVEMAWPRGRIEGWVPVNEIVVDTSRYCGNVLNLAIEDDAVAAPEPLTHDADLFNPEGHLVGRAHAGRSRRFFRQRAGCRPFVHLAYAFGQAHLAALMSEADAPEPLPLPEPPSKRRQRRRSGPPEPCPIP